MGNNVSKKESKPRTYAARRVTWDMCESLIGNKIFVSRDGNWYVLGQNDSNPVVLLSKERMPIAAEEDTKVFRKVL